MRGILVEPVSFAIAVASLLLAYHNILLYPITPDNIEGRSMASVSMLLILRGETPLPPTSGDICSVIPVDSEDLVYIRSPEFVRYCGG